MAVVDSSTSLAPSRAIVDLDAYVHNLDVARASIGPKPRIMAVMKADAYGHGLLPIARAAESARVDMVGVATVEEGVRLREAGIALPVTVLFQPPPGAAEAILEHDLTLVLADLAMADELGRAAVRIGRTARVHCQIDTGMGRQGFTASTVVDDLKAVTRVPGVDIEGVCTHFPTAYYEDDAATEQQFELFRALVKSLARAGVPFEMAHCANSPGAMFFPETAMDMVRVGLMTYGIWPGEAPPEQHDLRPVMRWETRVAQVRQHRAGETIGYGRTHTIERPTTVAVLPVGYADGYPYRLGNRAEVLVHGTRCKVLGRVCMDQTVVDITDAPTTHAGDTVTLVGQEGDERVTAEELADHAGTIPYEIVSGVSPRVPRVYTGAHS